MGFHGYPNDEVDIAGKSAGYFGANHHSLTCDITNFLDLESIIYHMDTPVGDPIIVPLYQLSKVASQHVKVIVAGEGADELFGGYLFQRKVTQLLNIRQYLSNLPFHVGSRIVRLIPNSLLAKL